MAGSPPRGARHSISHDSRHPINSYHTDQARDHLKTVDRAERKLQATAPAAGLAANAGRLGRLLRAHAQGRFYINFWAAATAAGALLYLVTVPDAIPDFVPVAGLADDGAVLAAAAGVLHAELERFAAWERGR